MKIIVNRTYGIKFCPKALNMTFGEFRKKRERINAGVARLDKCFCCGHKFMDNEKVIVVAVMGKGNRFACKKCFALYGREKNNGFNATRNS